jgi:hypothetical protein
VRFDELFFRPVEPEAGEEPEEDAPDTPWWGPPDRELGVCVPQSCVVARSDRGVVALSHVVAYSTGVHFDFVATGHGLKDSQVQQVFHHQHRVVPSEDLPDGLIRIGLELPGGARVSNLAGRFAGRDDEPDAPVLFPHGGGGGSGNRGRVTMRPGYWLWPLPLPGTLLLWCEWPLLDVPLSNVEIPTAAIVDAAARSIALY